MTVELFRARLERRQALAEFHRVIQHDYRLWHAYVAWLQALWAHPRV